MNCDLKKMLTLVIQFGPADVLDDYKWIRYHPSQLLLNGYPNCRFGMQNLLIPAHAESPSEIISVIYTHTTTTKNYEKSFEKIIYVIRMY